MKKLPPALPEATLWKTIANFSRTMSRSCQKVPGRWIACCWVTLALLTATPANSQSTVESTAERESAIAVETDQTLQQVSLTIDYGDGFSKVYGSLPWKEDFHISDAMTAAGKHAHPTKFGTRGNGTTAFLTSIDGIENQGFGKKSWIFYLNGEKGESSFAAVRLSPTDRVLWKYQKFP